MALTLVSFSADHNTHLVRAAITALILSDGPLQSLLLQIRRITQPSRLQKGNFRSGTLSLLDNSHPKG